LCAARAALSTEADFAQLQATLQSLPARLVILLGGWALLHHACAGIRFLLLDIHVGVELAQARRSSVVVLVASLVLTAALAVRLW
jgi:succinate dehydrogenase / fumarate reductase cytochrome b subunit